MHYRAIFEFASAAIFLYRINPQPGGPPLTLRDLNQKACALWCKTKKEVLCEDFNARAQPGLIGSFDALVCSYLPQSSACPQFFERQLGGGDTGEIWYEVMVRRMRIASEDFLQVVLRDIDDRKRVESALKLREQEHRSLAESLPDNIARFDLAGRYFYVNHVHERVLSMPATDMLGKTIGEIFPDGCYAAVEAAVAKVIATGQSVKVARQLVPLEGGAVRLHDVRLIPERDAEGKFCAVLCIGRDMTELYGLQDEITTREHDFRTLVENSPDTIARFDRNCRRVYGNPRLFSVLGGNLVHILGTTPSQFPGGASAEEYEHRLRQVFASGDEQNYEMRWQSHGLELCSHIRMTPEYDRNGQIAHVLAVGRDISAIDRYRREIHHQAFYDGLTGLPNRRFLADRISKSVSDVERPLYQFGLMLVDLDNFKNINDTLGHGIGDSLLCEASRRMQKCVRDCDTVARFGGDEFSVLLPDVSREEELSMIANRILEVLSTPFYIDGLELFVSGSIGISRYPLDSVNVDALHKYADSAMYQAKGLGRNNFQFYAEEMTIRSLDRMALESALRKACKNGELELYFQPQIEMASSRVTGAEALLRWNRPAYGLVMPDQFISIAEESGLIVEIGEWVLRTACATVAMWNRQHNAGLKVAVNVSIRQFLRNDLVGSVRRVLAETECEAAWLKLEITESLLLENSSEIVVMLTNLHEMGLAISLDDFGTGYSALSYLNQFPVSQLKIDRSFVQHIPGQTGKSELVSAMLLIARALNLESVAEGVENAEQAQYLLEHGCQFAQGYLFGKPMPRHMFEVLMLSGQTLS